MEPVEGKTQKSEKKKIGNNGMEKLIPAVNKMLDVCVKTGTSIHLDFPQIAVVGSQSSGKSSVLESFVGKDFLPRGTGIVTRRPLILQLINGSNEYGEFGHIEENKKFTDFNEIRKEIEAETGRGTEGSKGISKHPIKLRIVSPNVLNLTLVDLPGITKVPIGDQPEDIETQIKEMILEYIRNESCLILAVTPANSDLANSDALKLAKEVDIDGGRTIGVITKLDLMDEGTDAREILENRLKPLSRGYIGVVNRSQKMIDERKDIAEALKAERDFFLGHRYYRTIINRLGTPYLQRVLNQELTEHIRDKLPGLQDKLRTQMAALEKEVEQFSTLQAKELEDAGKPGGMRPRVHEVIKQLREDFEKAIGNLGLKDIDTKKLSNGAKINIIFHSKITAVQLNEAELRQDINFAVRNIFGTRSYLFTPYMVFETIMRKQVERLKEPVLACINSVVEQLTSAVRNCTKHISSYPNLRETIEHDIINFIHNNGPKYKESILSLIEMELAYTNIKHEEFLNNMNDAHSNLSGIIKNTGVISLSTCVLDPAKIPQTIVETAVNVASDAQLEGQNGIENGNGHASDAQSDDDNTVKSDGTTDESDDTTDKSDDGENITTKNGVPKSTAEKNNQDEFMNIVDPAFDKEVDAIYEKIESYMRIVKKTARDMVPKAITLYIINQLKDYINDELLKVLLALSDGDLSKLFALSPLEAENQKKKKETYDACKEAIEIIRNVSMDTVNGAIVDV